MCLDRVRYGVYRVSTTPRMTCYVIQYPCQFDVGAFVSSIKGVPEKPLWLVPVTGKHFEWTRDYNKHFRLNHIVNDYTNHFDATVLLSPVLCERGMYSSTVAREYIVPYLASLAIDHPSDPEYPAKMKQFTDIFKACAEQHDTVVLIG